MGIWRRYKSNHSQQPIKQKRAKNAKLNKLLQAKPSPHSSPTNSPTTPPIQRTMLSVLSVCRGIGGSYSS